MTPQDRLHSALQKIGHARAAIIRVAADWQAAGTETSSLTEPLCDIQEALSQLEILRQSLAPAPAEFVPLAATSATTPLPET